MSPRRYHQIEDGEWFSPVLDGYRLRCCDCDLTHTVDFRPALPTNIEMRLTRDNRSTAAARRRRK